MQTTPAHTIMRCIFLAPLLFAPSTIHAWTTTTGRFASMSVSPHRGSAAVSSSCPNAGRSSSLFLSDEPVAGDGGSEAAGPDEKTKMAMDLRRLFDIDEMAYTVMVREEQKGPDGKLTPEQLVAAIKLDSMFGEDLEEYCDRHATDENHDVKILDIGKFSEDFESSEPLPEEEGLTIQGKGNYLVYLSFAEGIRATMRIVVD